VVVSLYKPMPYIEEQLEKTAGPGDPGVWISATWEAGKSVEGYDGAPTGRSGDDEKGTNES
jgi:hypothetical protein